MAHDPAHHERRRRARRRHRRLWVALGLILALMAGEVVAGIAAGSLALLSDTAHMLRADAGRDRAGAFAGRASPSGRRAAATPTACAGPRSSQRRPPTRRCWRSPR